MRWTHQVALLLLALFLLALLGRIAQSTLFLHHLALAAEVVLGDHKVGHAFGLEPKRQVEPIGRHRLVIGGAILVGGAVVGPSRAQDVALEVARLQMLCLLE